MYLYIFKNTTEHIYFYINKITNVNPRIAMPCVIHIYIYISQTTT